MDTDTIDAFCPRCNSMSRLIVRSTAHARAPEQLFDRLEPPEEGLRAAQYSVAFCPTCDSVFLHVRALSEPSEIRYETLLYPTSPRRGIPGLREPVRRVFASAQSCFDTGNYEPCVIMCRKALEATCAFFAAGQGSLAARLRHLRDAGHLEARLFTWAEEVRLIGNDAAHEMDVDISKEDAADSLELVEAILLYVFALDERFNAFRARRQGSRTP